MSSLIFLAFSIITFIIIYGILFLIVPIILGAFYTVSDQIPIEHPEWAKIYEENEETTRYLVPLIPTVGLFIFILKVFMVASARGRE